MIAENEALQPVELIDCDHDLGDFAADGIKLLDWLLERGTLYSVALHTMNPAVRGNMRRLPQRYRDKREKQMSEIYAGGGAGGSFSQTCCFTGPRPKNYPWGEDEAARERVFARPEREIGRGRAFAAFLMRGRPRRGGLPPLQKSLRLVRCVPKSGHKKPYN